MDTRRNFIKKAMALSGAAGWTGLVPESISKAMAINPAPGSTYLDAEHIVILMQENRSFDHCFGTLQGVRGFNDPRRVDLPDGNPVWLQSNAKGETSPPFRFDIHGTKATWMGTTPHSRHSQVDAWNGGKYDKWLDAKTVGNKSYAHMPLTMGYYTRKDVPFNYALADAFTVCDQNFCSAMTSTWPNRLFLWSGTIREKSSCDAKAYVRNQIPYGEARWTTYPELLERAGVSWRVYQNDITAGGGFVGEERAWLSNYGCNPLEYLAQFNVRFSARYVAGLRAQVNDLPGEIEKLKAVLARPLPAAGQTGEEKNAHKKAIAAQEKARKDMAKKQAVLQNAQLELKQWSRENFDKLPAEAKALIDKAFTSNTADLDFHRLVALSYEENGEKRELNIPKGDIFHQFRQDVNQGNLPTVSWLVGPEKFSDHPSAPWFGSWYVSEVLDILTRNPEVWKKTIFILTYDENDGYFDHIPPYVAPDPHRPETGRCSPGIDPGAEYITLENELRDGIPLKEARRGPIGLGFRVPMIVASPWSRGGRVCSHVFDHTSVFRFVQDFLNRKTGSKIQEATTSDWRKTVTGHLGMVFRPYHGDGRETLRPLDKIPFIEGIYNAKFRDVPTNYKVLTPEEIAQYTKHEDSVGWMPRQEPGVRPSCALPYQLYAEGALNGKNNEFSIKLEARKDIFGEASSGSPFNIFFPGKYAVVAEEGQAPRFEHVGYRSYAVAAGDSLLEAFPIAAFEDGVYHACVHGPNGFFREFRGNSADPRLSIECDYDRASGKPSGKLRYTIRSLDPGESFTVEIKDQAYGKKTLRKQVLAPNGRDTTLALVLDLKDSHGWYDFSLSVTGFDTFLRRYAGRIDTGEDGFTDPYMGRAI